MEVEPATSTSPVGHVSNWATEAKFRFNNASTQEGHLHQNDILKLS